VRNCRADKQKERNLDNWNLLEEILFTSTSPDWTASELEYLKDAYLQCEELWAVQVGRIREPRLIMIGEAPLYGEKKSYIYSPTAYQTAFLYESDFDESAKEMGGTPLEKKARLLDRMAGNGVVVVDAFPYALNAKSTPTMYFQKGENKMKPQLYNQLLKNVFDNHTASKISNLISKDSNAKIAIRYERTAAAIGSVLEKNGFEQPHSIWQQGGGIDKGTFRELLQ